MKFCKDCKHVAETFRLNKNDWRCTHPAQYAWWCDAGHCDPLAHSWPTCSKSRSDANTRWNSPCGYEGKLFEPREADGSVFVGSVFVEGMQVEVEEWWTEKTK